MLHYMKLCEKLHNENYIKETQCKNSLKWEIKKINFWK